MSLNNELAELFKTAAAVMEIKGEAVFKSIAFSKVARLLGELPFDIRKSVEDGSIDTITGIGKSSRKIIEDVVRTGTSADIESLKSSIPEGLVPMMQIPSLGPKTISMLWKQRGITNIGELTVAIVEGKLEGLKGLGEKKIQSIKDGITMLTAGGGRIGLINALPIAEKLLEQVRALKGVERAEVAGSLRRWRETIGDVDIVAAVSATSTRGHDISRAFTKFPQVGRVLGQGETKSSVLVDGGLQVDLRIVPEEHFGAAMQYFTGSKEHNVTLRGLAQDKGMTLNEWGLYKLTEYDKAKKLTGKPPAVPAVASRSEEDIYEALGMDWIPPELREDRGEIALATAHKVPKLIVVKDIRGDLHSHTKASDGDSTIEQMAEAAIALGYEYLGITDHSKSQVIANGLSVERLLKHLEAIRKVAAKIKGIKVLASCEVDILTDGTLDYGDEILKELDYVIASPHASLKQDPKKATDRLLRAVDNRYVNIIGHPTGRKIDKRGGLPVEFETVFARAAKAGVAMEINAGWPRLDLNDVNARAAIAAGVMLSVNTDAHSISDFEQLPLGISVARRAGAEAKNVINTLDHTSLMKFLTRKR
ncbi:MAG: DNA polymerase/3'-5' exonuclease PolX [Burkholderiales bacterium]|nr:DNA polymerase/3'-5' exonuclease PolX [Phycisphaerae bacterium]